MDKDKEFMAKFDLMFEKINGIESKMTKLTNTIEKVNRLEEENVKLKNDIQVLKKTCWNQEQRVRNLEQYSRKRNVIISGMKKAENENLKEIIKSFGSEIHIKINDCDINAAHRLPAKEGKIPAIIMCLNNLELKEELINWSKGNKKNRATSKFPTVYINEHLTRENEEILREALSRDEIQFAWFKNGSVYIRRNESSRAEKIISINQLNSALSAVTENEDGTSLVAESDTQPENQNGNSTNGVNSRNTHTKQKPITDFVSSKAPNMRKNHQDGGHLINTRSKTTIRDIHSNTETG